MFAIFANLANQTRSKAARGRIFARLKKVAYSKRGHSYRYGAVGPNHFDCSGFTQYVYRKAVHKRIPRTAQAQYRHTKHVKKTHIKQGDLVYFGHSSNSISHVGMYVGHGKMIDSQNRGVVTERVHAPWWNFVAASRPANLTENRPKINKTPQVVTNKNNQ